MFHLCKAHRFTYSVGALVIKNLNTPFKTCIKVERLYSSFKRHTPVNRCRNYLLFDTRNRLLHDKRNQTPLKLKSFAYYLCGLGVLVVGLSYAAVPMYRIFCQAFSYGGVVADTHSKEIDLSNMKKHKNREIRVQFNAEKSAKMAWKFRPQMSDVKVAPGETALAFYTAENPLDRPVIGISTYNVVPFEAGQYFNKIQCFCFEEQMLNPHEQVDMPVFFYIDPEFVNDPKMEYVDNIILSYTFFEVKEGMNLPIPPYYSPHKT